MVMLITNDGTTIVPPPHISPCASPNTRVKIWVKVSRLDTLGTVCVFVALTVKAPIVR
jgi:hypothetical protein